jgi:hypothetical protein
MTTGKVVSEVLSLLPRTKAHAIGLVMNRVKTSGAGYSYHYYLVASDAEHGPPPVRA